MTGQQPWSRHYQHVWQERAGQTHLPLWLRVVSLAYGSHLGNGHARFGPGEVRLTMSTVDANGVMCQPDGSAVRRAIRQAVSNGFLAPGSKQRCLVVPAHAVEGGRGGSSTQYLPCPDHCGK